MGISNVIEFGCEDRCIFKIYFNSWQNKNASVVSIIESYFTNLKIALFQAAVFN